jgi:transaldolase / glucose-6-phosphate isomerase
MATPTGHTLPSAFDRAIIPTLRQLNEQDLIDRIWAKEHRVWKPEPREISDRLGWLTLHEQMPERVDELRALVSMANELRIQHVVLLGMGGSSLGPEVLRASFGQQKGAPRLWVLDSTVPGWVKQVSQAIVPARTLFLVASKSGGTIEVLSLFAHFWDLVAKAKGNHGGRQFVAITDPGTGLERMALEYGFGQVIINPPDIGGRYSVLSLFGLVPAALMGVDVERLLARAGGMAQRCRRGESAANPGAYLGAAMGALAQAGRDKMTVMASPSIATFGLWAEQLVAESTGKEGTGLIPVAQEPLVAPRLYGSDRLFLYLRLKGDKNTELDRHEQALRKASHPVLRFDLNDRYDLAAEFFRWEFATAVAGHVLGIHPFDQPNVQESKDNTSRVLGQFESTGRLPKQSRSSPAQAAQELTTRAEPGRYVAILAYTTPSRSLESAVRRLRAALVSRHHVATTFGYGPRYLHSTGQLHKGGPNSGIFLELIDRMRPDLAIPGKRFSFGTLARAQAAGDLESLRAHERIAVSVEFGRNPAATVAALLAALTSPRSHSQRRPAKRPRAKSRRR